MIIALAAGGCVRHRQYTVAELRAELAAIDGSADALVVPFEVTPRQAELAHKRLASVPAEAHKARALAELMNDPMGFGVSYRNVVTATGARVLSRGGGNCLSLASAYVGLARALGLEATYVDVQDGEEERLQRRDAAVRVGHITAVVRTSSGFVSLDINGMTPLRRGSWVMISDLEATAHFHNNLGFELMVEAEESGRPAPWKEIARQFELATRIHPGMTRAWNNLGVARSRLDDVDGAVEALRQAVRHDPRFSTAYINLARVLVRRGSLADAASVLDRAALLPTAEPVALAEVRRLMESATGTRSGAR